MVRKYSRGGGGGRMGGGINRKHLSQVMDSCGKELTTAEDIADDLRSKYADFVRLTRQVLLLNVRHILNDKNRNNSKRVKDEEVEEEDGDEEIAAKRKKQRHVDEKEEKLRKAEESHLRKRKKEQSVSSSSEDEEDSGDVSTSEDAIYSEKLTPPRFDLINDSLRDNYAKLNNSSLKKLIAVEKIVEVETVSNKGRKMATMGSRKEAKSSPSVSGNNNNGDLVVEGVKGPTFKDFGGIKKVLDELEMIVLFPLHLILLKSLINVLIPAGSSGYREKIIHRNVDNYLFVFGFTFKRYILIEPLFSFVLAATLCFNLFVNTLFFLDYQEVQYALI